LVSRLSLLAQLLALPNAHGTALQCFSGDGVSLEHSFLEECDGIARRITDELEFGTRAIVRDVSGCPRRGNKVDRSASFTQDAHTNRHRWLPQTLMLSSEPRPRTMVVTEQECSHAFAAGTLEFRIARLFHVGAAPTDETTIGFRVHFEKAVLFDAIAAAYGFLYFSYRSSRSQVHGRSSLLKPFTLTRRSKAHATLDKQRLLLPLFLTAFRM
jgi:hypothetical protein